MDLRRLRIGELIAGAAGILLIVSLFLPWYGFDGTLPDGTPFELPDQGLNGWEALTGFDLVLVLAGLLGIALVVLTAAQRTPALPLAMSALVTVVALIAVVIMAFRVFSLPGPPDSVPDQLQPLVDAAREGGLWVALLAALAQLVGGAVAMRDERLSPPDRTTDITGRPAPPPEPVEPLPAPTPAPRVESSGESSR